MHFLLVQYNKNCFLVPCHVTAPPDAETRDAPPRRRPHRATRDRDESESLLRQLVDAVADFTGTRGREEEYNKTKVELHKQQLKLQEEQFERQMAMHQEQLRLQQQQLELQRELLEYQRQAQLRQQALQEQMAQVLLFSISYAIS